MRFPLIFGSGLNHSCSWSVGCYILRIHQESILKFVGDSVFERVFQWFALMQIREDWGDSLVLSSCVPLPAVWLCRGGVQIQSLSTSPIVLWCCHQTKGEVVLQQWLSDTKCINKLFIIEYNWVFFTLFWQFLDFGLHVVSKAQ